jgi:NADH-quinone oxidoreductase subunit N
VSETFQILLPQTLLACVACLFILGGTFPVSPRRWGPLALFALVATAGALHYNSGLRFTKESLESLAVSHSAIGTGIQWTCLVVGALFVLISMETQAASKTAAEFYGLLLLLLSGILLVAAANDLILLFLSLELISIPTYILLYLGRKDSASQEAAIKYFLLSILSAAVLLYGFAMLYGLTGSTRLGAIHDVLGLTYRAAETGMPAAGGSSLGIVALVLIFAGLGFKIAAVPFHFYAPDVYEGTTSFNAGLLSVGPKIAGFVALIHVVSQSLVGFETTGQQLALIVAAITMTGGNCLALLQTNIRRMLAYSSIAHAGYMLIGIAVGFWESWNPNLRLDGAAALGLMGLPGGIGATYLYLLAYSLTTVGLFGALVYLGRPGKEVNHVDELTGLGKTHPFLASVIALFLFSLAGIPPLPGFWAKLAVFATALSVRQEVSEGIFAVHPAFFCLAIIGVLNAAIGGVYYLRLIAVMFLNEPLGTARPAGGRPAYVGVIGAALLAVALGLFPGPVFEFLQRVETSPNPPAAAVIAPAGQPVAEGS